MIVHRAGTLLQASVLLLAVLSGCTAGQFWGPREDCASAPAAPLRAAAQSPDDDYRAFTSRASGPVSPAAPRLNTSVAPPSSYVDELARSDVLQAVGERLPPVRLLATGPDASDELPAPATEPLSLNEVIRSVETHFPLLLAAMQEQRIASGLLLAAQGAFDLMLRGRESVQLGTYESNRVDLGIEQYVPWSGWSYFAGYRQSAGDFPIYYGERKTGDGGEFRAGVLFPLLANRAIDRRRATLRQAEINRALADPIIAAQRIDFIRAAARAYWTWIAAGRRYQVALSVLQIAQQRDQQLAELVQRGAIAEFERMDNQRVIVERQARLVAAERVWQQASIALSLYLRTADGQPQFPSAARLPRKIEEPLPFDLSRIPADIELAFQQRPELDRFRLQRDRTAVELELADNQKLPSLNLGLEWYQDVGYGSDFSKTPLVTGTQLDRAAYMASLQLDLPLQRRDARGRAAAARSTITQLGYQERFQRDRIVAEIQDAASALERSRELFHKARENVTVARKVEDAERERFMRGQSTIVILNLRELVSAEAAFAEIDALAEYYRSAADYRAALGIDAR